MGVPRVPIDQSQHEFLSMISHALAYVIFVWECHFLSLFGRLITPPSFRVAVTEQIITNKIVLVCVVSFSGSSSLIVVVVVNGFTSCVHQPSENFTPSSRRRRRSQRCPPLLPTANNMSLPLFTFTPSMTPSSQNISPSFRNNA